eukprot:TRINITY_DN46917_c0_g1_i1.p1 TRINITY_DN46917_c0_g1~~TRINITY_DN46917_c0_g1_i1.p1  ORF type:complete len:1039 (+),score=129.44 TRINITY_DN46917_c0_g1_i1:104-3220(+)
MAATKAQLAAAWSVPWLLSTLTFIVLGAFSTPWVEATIGALLNVIFSAIQGGVLVALLPRDAGFPDLMTRSTSTPHPVLVVNPLGPSASLSHGLFPHCRSDTGVSDPNNGPAMALSQMTRMATMTTVSHISDAGTSSSPRSRGGSTISGGARSLHAHTLKSGSSLSIISTGVRHSPRGSPRQSPHASPRAADGTKATMHGFVPAKLRRASSAPCDLQAPVCIEHLESSPFLTTDSGFQGAGFQSPSPPVTRTFGSHSTWSAPLDSTVPIISVREGASMSACCLVLLHLEDSGLGDWPDPQALDDCSELRYLVSRTAAEVAPHGGIVSFLDPFGGKVVLSFRRSDLRTAHAAALDFVQSIQTPFQGLPLHAVVGDAFLAQLSDISHLGSPALTAVTRMLAITRHRRVRTLVAGPKGEPPRVGMQRLPDTTALAPCLWTFAGRPQMLRSVFPHVPPMLTVDELAAAAFATTDNVDTRGLAWMWRRVNALATSYLSEREVRCDVLQETEAVRVVRDALRREFAAQQHSTTDWGPTDWLQGCGTCPELATAGERNAGEDTSFGFLDLRIFDDGLEPGLSLVGIFDGHGGPYAAEYARAQLPREVARLLGTGVGPTGALRAALRAVDRRFILRYANTPQANCGCTATVSLITAEKIYIGHLGDSRAVGGRANVFHHGQRWPSCSSRRLTTDHHVINPSELGAVEARGGAIIRAQGALRVDGLLCVTRAIGDRAVRASLDLEPQITVYDREPFDYVIFATDGLWSVFDDDEVCRHVGVSRHAVDSGDMAPTETLSSHRTSMASGASATAGSPQRLMRVPQDVRLTDSLNSGTADLLELAAQVVETPSRTPGLPPRSAHGGGDTATSTTTASVSIGPRHSTAVSFTLDRRKASGPSWGGNSPRSERGIANAARPPALLSNRLNSVRSVIRSPMVVQTNMSPCTSLTQTSSMSFLDYSVIAAALASEALERMTLRSSGGQHDDVTVVIAFFPKRDRRTSEAFSLSTLPVPREESMATTITTPTSRTGALTVKLPPERGSRHSEDAD